MVQWVEKLEDYDPFLSPTNPPNPWISDDCSLWLLNTDTCVESNRILNCIKKEFQCGSTDGEESKAMGTFCSWTSQRLHRQTSARNVPRKWIFKRKHSILDRDSRFEVCQKWRNWGKGRAYIRRIPCAWCALSGIFIRITTHSSGHTINEYLLYEQCNSACQVNVDSRTLERTIECLESSKNHRHAFFFAEEHVFTLMSKDSYPRFVRSNIYKACSFSLYLHYLDCIITGSCFCSSTARFTKTRMEEFCIQYGCHEENACGKQADENE